MDVGVQSQSPTDCALQLVPQLPCCPRNPGLHIRFCSRAPQVHPPRSGGTARAHYRTRIRVADQPTHNPRSIRPPRHDHHEEHEKTRRDGAEEEWDAGVVVHERLAEPESPPPPTVVAWAVEVHVAVAWLRAASDEADQMVHEERIDGQGPLGGVRSEGLVVLVVRKQQEAQDFAPHGPAPYIGCIWQ